MDSGSEYDLSEEEEEEEGSGSEEEESEAEEEKDGEEEAKQLADVQRIKELCSHYSLVKTRIEDRFGVIEGEEQGSGDAMAHSVRSIASFSKLVFLCFFCLN